MKNITLRKNGMSIELPISDLKPVTFLISEDLPEVDPMNIIQIDNKLDMDLGEYLEIFNSASRKELITRYMMQFRIGVDYKLDPDGHSFLKIRKLDHWTYLQNENEGVKSLIAMLFNIASNLDIDTHRCEKLFLIEYPESYLHPNLQSKLADLFYELNRDYGYRFIIKTHSEYLIRNTQALVKEHFENQFSKNPFKVIYFNSPKEDEIYYEVKYRSDGIFENDFGKGFFDEASKLVFKIL